MILLSLKQIPYSVCPLNHYILFLIPQTPKNHTIWPYQNENPVLSLDSLFAHFCAKTKYLISNKKNSRNENAYKNSQCKKNTFNKIFCQQLDNSPLLIRPLGFQITLRTFSPNKNPETLKGEIQKLGFERRKVFSLKFVIL